MAAAANLKVDPASRDVRSAQGQELIMAVPIFARDASSVSKSDAVSAAAAAAMLGIALLFVAGFAQPQALHDAAHDTRHSFAFPCH